jgi:cellulose synthase/poly-beta-1,6-N-acetylglucosamine synthase-like glycosyltransferase
LVIVKMEIFQVVFWFAVAVLIYVYVGYPLLLAVATQGRTSRSMPMHIPFPRVTLLISAHNERLVIEERLRNALSSDYPKDGLEILVISDCSDDGTDEIVAGFAGQGVRLVRQPERLGKSEGLNLGVAQATGDLLVFSDANAIYQPDAVRLLVRHFSDPQVGYVVGHAHYVERAGQAHSAESEGLYWKLETWLKEKESSFGSVVGGDGAIYAIRRELFTPLRPTDINDFLNPLQIIARGYRGVYEPAAVCFEEAGDSFGKEFRRKVRIISRSLNAVRRAPRVLLPWTQPRHWLALMSHKVLRWFVPLFLLLTLLASLFLWRLPFYRWTFFLQAAFYAVAAAGWVVETNRAAPKVLYLPYYFCLVNLASLLGVIKFLSGSLSPTWETIRQETPARRESPARMAGKES